MAKQGFPNLDTPLIDDNGNLAVVWFRFFAALWARSGGADGNNSANFLYPTNTGSAGQVLTSSGPAAPTTWTTLLTKLSQFANDIGFITSSALGNYSTTSQTASQISTAILAQESNFIPPADTLNGAVGISPRIARADHSHPREISPAFSGQVSATALVAPKVTIGAATVTSGNGIPGAAQPNGSIYLNTAGGAGTHVYVSNGATWAAVPGV
jgi:hypothetical protein